MGGSVMKNKVRLISFICFLMLGRVPAVQDYHGLGEEEIHPGYDLMTIRPFESNRDMYGNPVAVYPNSEEFNAPVVGMAWHPDGDLLILTWRGSSGPMAADGFTGDYQWHGRLFKLSGVYSNSREDIQGVMVADNFKDSHGITIVNREIYVGDIDRLVKLVDENGDGFYETHQLIGAIPHGNGWFEYTYGPVYRNGKFYFTTANHFQGSGYPNENVVPDKGSVLEMDMNGDYVAIASGLREPNGIVLGPEDEIFITDNQGCWRPSSPFIHVQRGRNYGYKSAGTEFLGAFFHEPVSPPAVWGVYREIEEGPTGPGYMTTGLYREQFFCGDIGRGGIKRWFVEKVKGEYQGGVVPFCGGLEVGIDRIIIDSEGVIFAGGVGNGDMSNQGWLGKRHGLQRLTPNGNITFEVLRAYSRNGGMELEFTKPVFDNAPDASLYAVEQYTMIPELNYGGGSKRDRSEVSVSTVEVSSDRTRVFLGLDGLKEGFVVHIKMPESFTSSEGEALWFHEVWYTLNSISETAPFDIPGCTDPKYEEFSQEATYDDGSCAALDVNADRAFKRGHVVETIKGQLVVEVPFAGEHSVQLANVGGTVVQNSSWTGPLKCRIPVSGFRPGVYVLSITSEGSTQSRKVILQ
jgi:hypothetical protein